MPRIAELDDTRRCTYCRHFYVRVNGKAKQLPLEHVDGAGLLCAECKREVCSPRWDDDVVKHVDGVAAEQGLLAA